MLLEYLDKLRTLRIVLASGSPRRKEILQSLNLNFEVVVSNFEEDLDPGDYPHVSEFTVATAEQKCDAVLKSMASPPDLIIAADTVVVFENKIIGKPKDDTQAVAYLKMLSGNTHTVYTGVVLKWPKIDNKTVKFWERTNVQFATLTDSIVNAYVATAEPRDKAGGYGIQGLGGTLISSIEGDYFTVMGLPLHATSSRIYEHYSTCDLV